MTTITQELERTAHDVTTAPSFRDSAEIALAGGAVGALLGFLKHRNKSDAIRYAWWGAGLGITGQYMVFHMLKPAMKQFGRSAMHAATFGGMRHVAGAPPLGHPHFGRQFMQQQQPMMPPPMPQCPIGFITSPITGQCVPLSSLGLSGHGHM